MILSKTEKNSTRVCPLLVFFDPSIRNFVSTQGERGEGGFWSVRAERVEAG